MVGDGPKADGGWRLRRESCWSRASRSLYEGIADAGFGGKRVWRQEYILKHEVVRPNYCPRDQGLVLFELATGFGSR